MIITLVALAALCLFGIKIHKHQNEEYLDKEQTGAIKGVFVVTVFLVHVIQYFSLHDGMADKLFDFGMAGKTQLQPLHPTKNSYVDTGPFRRFSMESLGVYFSQRYRHLPDFLGI